MRSFLHRYAHSVTGFLAGFDRLIFHGKLAPLYRPDGLKTYLYANRILLKDWRTHAREVTRRIVRTMEAGAKRLGRPVIYREGAGGRQEREIRERVRSEGLQSGLVAVLTAVEPCLSYDVQGNRETHKLELVLRKRKCLHYYGYYQHSRYGLLHVRVQTWFPFAVQIWINGREWLEQELGKRKIDYLKNENSFPWLADVERAQRAMDLQLREDWPKQLEALRREAHGLHEEIFRNWPLEYYWTVFAEQALKAYDKGTLFRVEATFNGVKGYRVYRRVSGVLKGPREWLPLRKGVADLPRRASLSRKATERYLEAVGQLEAQTPLSALTEEVSKPVRKEGRRYRALQVLGPEDGALLGALSDGAFTLNGFRNRDLRAKLYALPAGDPKEQRRQTAKISRKLRLLRMHGVIHKVPRTHRYQLSAKGRLLVTAVIAARQASVQKLTESIAA
jgi:hypothetical protein